MLGACLVILHLAAQLLKNVIDYGCMVCQAGCVDEAHTELFHAALMPPYMSGGSICPGQQLTPLQILLPNTEGHIIASQT